MQRSDYMRYVLMGWGLLLFFIVTGANANASGPRWVTGQPFFYDQGNAVVWYTNQPLYFTDPGDLSSTVDHDAADALVASAAAVWNVPTSMMVLQQGGTLDQHISGDNVYLGSSGLIFPADTQSANYAEKQIAVIYDSDGSVTDLLLGGGASEPENCRQTGVTESVDSITTSGIQHAVLILNGRCTGAAPEAQLQLQYQLVRAFGRILGLGWSQVNDNVFTGAPQPTYNQYLNWPIMHPIDIVCGPYTYQCLPQPFTLRIDDVASISALYPVSNSNVPPGKQPTLGNANAIHGVISFPTGEGMAGVNLVITRNRVPEQYVEPWQEASVVTGAYAQQDNGNPMNPRPSDWAGSQIAADFTRSMGTNDPYFRGYFRFPYLPLPSGDTIQDELITSEPINPLYVGAYSVGPYPTSTVTPSGSSPFRLNGWHAGDDEYVVLTASNAQSNCDTDSDGTEASPQALPPSGSWTGQICAYGHNAWSYFSVRADRSLTLEVTAVDEQGVPTVNKALPVLGLWQSSDLLGSQPTVASTVNVFNSATFGMTTLAAQSGSQPMSYRMVISDQRGDGRPDFNYRARLLYADSIAPASGRPGTQVTITGFGFRPGNQVTINGISANVTSWTPTTIVATVPPLSNLPTGSTTPVDVAVTDLSTHGSTVMSRALQYISAAPVYTLALLSSPSGNLPISLAADATFSVKAIDVDGVTPLAGVPIIFSTVAGAVQWGACANASCTVLTDAKGVAAITVTPLQIGVLTLQAAGLGQVQLISFVAVPLLRTVTVSPSTLYLAPGVKTSWSVTATMLQQGLAVPYSLMSWSATDSSLILSVLQSATGAQGQTQINATAGPLASGQQVNGSACAWSSICGNFTVQAIDSSQFVLSLGNNPIPAVTATENLPSITLEVTDAAGNPIIGANVEVHQTISQWTTPCTTQGRCPIAPVYQTSSLSLTSGMDGTVVFTPLQIAGPEVTDIVATTGTQGFISLSLEKQP